MKIQINTIGQHHDQPIHEALITSSTGVQIAIMSYGAILRDWRVPTIHGLRSVVLGFPHYTSYFKDTEHLGAIIGRVANRISNAQFNIGTKNYPLPANVGNDLLHGGPLGLSRRHWKMQLDKNSVLLTYLSPAGEMGFPGEVHFEARYTLHGSRLRLEMSAQVSEVTPINMVQHHYFNLMGTDSVFDHHFQIRADHYTPLNERLTPTGDLLPVSGSIFDFNKVRNLRDQKGDPITYDVNLALSQTDRKLNPVARVTAPDNSLQLQLWTEQPGLQFYTSEHLYSQEPGHFGRKYNKFDGFCLEDQMFPDALHHSHFPSILVSPETPYYHWCEIEIS